MFTRSFFIILLLLPMYFYIVISLSRNHMKVHNLLPQCSEYENSLELKICELYHIELQDENEVSEHEKIREKYEDALAVSRTLQPNDLINLERFFYDFIAELKPDYANLMKPNIKLGKSLMKDDIYTIVSHQSVKMIKKNYQYSSINIVAQKFSEVDLWIKEVNVIPIIPLILYKLWHTYIFLLPHCLKVHPAFRELS